MLSRFFRRTSKTKPTIARQSRLRVESLESRIVLTAGTASVVDGVLTICGTTGGETIIVAELADDYFVAANFLSTPQRFPKSGITTILVEAGDGNDTVVATSTTIATTLRGEGGDDRLFGGQAIDLIEGGTGEDLIYGNGNHDSIDGGDGNDVVFGGLGDDTIDGGLGNDTLIGMDGDDAISGEEGDDNIGGGGGDDTLFGNLGNDQILGGAGNDTSLGGDGNDVLTGDGDNDDLFGQDGDDTLLGSGGADRLFGGAGNDRVVGSFGDDLISGDDGIDELFGDDGNDIMHGGLGNDSFFAGKGRDTLFGNDGDDTLRGGDGDDVLSGHGGADELLAGDGKDILIGGEGGDTLRGEGNQDFLIAGTTSHQTDADALEESRVLWLTSDHFEVRVADVLPGFTVNNPNANAGDLLFGGNGQDSFYASSAEVSDRQSIEPVIGESFIAMSDLFFANIDETITTTLIDGVLANDISVAGGVQATGIITGASHGSLSPGAASGLDGDFSFTMDTHGRDQFIYEATDANGNTWMARARIVVPDLPPLPDGVSLTATGTGLEVYDFTTGTGSTPGPTNNVLVDYVGYLPNGQIFDQRDDITFNLGDVIDGFSEGLQGMQPGSSRRIVIPPDLGYGAGGNLGAGIGGTDTIIFDVTLHSFTT